MEKEFEKFMNYLAMLDSEKIYFLHLTIDDCGCAEFLGEYLEKNRPDDLERLEKEAARARNEQNEIQDNR